MGVDTDPSPTLAGSQLLRTKAGGSRWARVGCQPTAPGDPCQQLLLLRVPGRQRGAEPVVQYHFPQQPCPPGFGEEKREYQASGLSPEEGRLHGLQQWVPLGSPKPTPQSAWGMSPLCPSSQSPGVTGAGKEEPLNCGPLLRWPHVCEHPPPSLGTISTPFS